MQCVIGAGYRRRVAYVCGKQAISLRFNVFAITLAVHWSATTRSGVATSAYYLNLSGAGSVSHNPKTNSNYVRAVRGGL